MMAVMEDTDRGKRCVGVCVCGGGCTCMLLHEGLWGLLCLCIFSMANAFTYSHLSFSHYPYPILSYAFLSHLSLIPLKPHLNRARGAVGGIKSY